MKTQFTTAALSAARGILRFAALTAVMLCGVLLLALAEGLVLWRAGTEYTPPSRLVHAGARDFELTNGGACGVSCVLFSRHASRSAAAYHVYWHDLRRPGRPVRVAVDADPRAIAASPDHSWLAVVGWDASIRLFRNPRRDESSTLLYMPARETVSAILGSPDGRFLAAATDRCVSVWDAETAQLVQQWPAACERCVCLAFSGDSQTLTTLDAGGAVERRSTATGVLQARRRLGCTHVQDAAISPAGNVACCRDYRGSLAVFDLESGRPLWSGDRDLDGNFPFATGAGIAVSSDGAWIASAVRRSPREWRIRIRDARTGRTTAEFGRHEAYPHGMLFDPGGGLYVWDSAGEIVRWAPHTGRELWRFSWRSSDARYGLLEEWGRSPVAGATKETQWREALTRS